MNAELLASARALQLEELESTGLEADIHSVTTEQNEIGEEVETVSDDPTNTYPCNVQAFRQGGGTEKEVGGKAVQTGLWDVILPWNAAVTENDEIRISGSRYQVVEAPTEHPNRFTLHAICLKIS